MRLFVSGSAPLPAQVLEEFRALFGHTILERYGMTETMMNISNPYVGERRPGSVGLPLPGISCGSSARGPEAVDETGEMYLKGPNVFAGYWRREEATRGGISSTAGSRPAISRSRSPDGYYTLSGRKSDLIISGGFNIYPREIEEFLMEQPEVAEAAVVGEPDRVRGEVPVAYIVCQATATVDAGAARSALPRKARVLQNSAPFRGRRKTAPQRAGQGPEAHARAYRQSPLILMVTRRPRRLPKPGGLGRRLGACRPRSQTAAKKCRGAAAIRLGAHPGPSPHLAIEMPLAVGPHLFTVAIDQVDAPRRPLHVRGLPAALRPARRLQRGGRRLRG